MPDTTISDLPQANVINGATVVPADYDGATYKVSADTLKAYIGGLPVGGTAGQVLAKINATDYNAEWTTPSSGGSAGFEQTFLLMGA
jgi:hypothetical protein